MESKCENCKHWRGLKPEVAAGARWVDGGYVDDPVPTGRCHHGHCKRYPPSVFVPIRLNDQAYNWIWPVTRAEDICGEWT